MLSLNVYSPNYTKTFSTSKLLQTRKWKSWHHISVRKLTYPISGTSSSMIISFKSSCRLAIRERWVTSSRIFTKKGNIWSNKQTCRTTNKQTNKECLEYVVITNFSRVKKDLGKKKREEYLACPDNKMKWMLLRLRYQSESISKNWSNKLNRNF